MSFAVILPFLKPIRHLLEADTVSEIMVNPDASVWIEEDGQIQRIPEFTLRKVHCSPASK